MAIRELQKIPVSRNHSDLETFLLVALRKGTDHIVRLKALERHGSNVHGRQQFLKERHLLPQFIRHGLSGSLVIRVALMAEGRRRQVKGDRKIVRLLLLEQFQ